MNTTVIGVFDTKTQAESARRALENNSFTEDHYDVTTFGENGRYDDRYASATDSVYAFFANLFSDDEETARAYTNVARRGTVVTVYTDSMADAKRAAAILDEYGAVDMDERCATYSAAEVDVDGNYSEDTIKVIEEDIAVGKREVETGSATIRARVIEKPVEETLRLREENIFIKRTPVDRPATDADFDNTTATITVTETAEEAVVSKDARVVEEISIGKEVNTRTETITDTVRETEVDVVETEGEVVREYDETYA